MKIPTLLGDTVVTIYTNNRNAIKVLNLMENDEQNSTLTAHSPSNSLESKEIKKITNKSFLCTHFSYFHCFYVFYINVFIPVIN